MRKKIIILLILFNCILNAQNNKLDSIIIEFNCFKYLDTEYKIDYNKNELTCIMKRRISRNRDTIFSNKTYHFRNREFKRFKDESNKNIPDSIIRKYESALDGGGFVINYFKKNRTSSKLITRNIFINSDKYEVEYKLINSFFDFMYSIVKDNEGLQILDESYHPYFSGLPIRKVSEKPLEYKIWGTISGNATWKNTLIPFLEGLPKDKCVIIDCDNQLSYAWQEDILRLYILKNSNLRFANIDYLKYTREYLIEFKKKYEKAGNNKEELDKLKKTTTYDLYVNNIDEIEEWLKLPESLIYRTVEEYRKNCR